MRSGTTDGCVGLAAERAHEIGRENDGAHRDCDRDDEQEVGCPGDLQRSAVAIGLLTDEQGEDGEGDEGADRDRRLHEAIGKPVDPDRVRVLEEREHERVEPVAREPEDHHDAERRRVAQEPSPRRRVERGDDREREAVHGDEADDDRHEVAGRERERGCDEPPVGVLGRHDQRGRHEHRERDHARREIEHDREPEVEPGLERGRDRQVDAREDHRDRGEDHGRRAESRCGGRARR